jgi:GTP-binding protein HflX
VSEALTQHFLDVDIETDVANGRLLAYLAQHGEILSRTFTGDRVSVHCRMPSKYLGRIRAEDAMIRHREPEHRNGTANGNGRAHSNGAVKNGAVRDLEEDVA